MDHTSAHDESQKTASEKLRELSLRAAGIGFILGDAAFFTADRLNNDKNGSMTGLIYLAGAATAARYGKQNPDRQIELLGRRLRSYLQEQGVPIPQGTALDAQALAKPRGLFDHIEDFLYQHPSQVLNTMFGAGGMVKVAAELKKGKDKSSTAIAYGGLVALAAAIGLFVSEKAPDPEHPKNSFFGKIGEKIQQAPLRITGAIYLGNNGFLIHEAWKQRKAHLAEGNKSGYYFSFLTAACYIVANSLLMVSSKHHDKALGSEQKRTHEALEAMSAQVLANAPEAVRGPLVEQVAGFLSAQPEFKANAQEITQAIQQKISASAMQVWQQRVAAGAPIAEVAR